jgi:hypothetical protein
MSQDTQHERQIISNPFLSAVRQLLGIIVEFGMTTVAFGAGIYAFILFLHVNMAPEITIGVALVLMLAALVAQLWMFARLNPPVQSDEVKDQLSRMTRLVERLADNSSQRNLPPPPAHPGA